MPQYYGMPLRFAHLWFFLLFASSTEIQFLNRAALDSACRLRYKFLHLKPCSKLSRLCELRSVLTLQVSMFPCSSSWNHVFCWSISFQTSLVLNLSTLWEREAAVSNSSRARAMAAETSFFVNFVLFLELGCRKGVLLFASANSAITTANKCCAIATWAGDRAKPVQNLQQGDYSGWDYCKNNAKAVFVSTWSSGVICPWSRKLDWLCGHEIVT